MWDVDMVLALASYNVHTSCDYNPGIHPHYTRFAPCCSDSISTTHNKVAYQIEVKLKAISAILEITVLPTQGICKGSLTCRSCSIAGCLCLIVL
jgi:hypothetical protein